MKYFLIFLFYESVNSAMAMNFRGPYAVVSPV